MAKKSSRARQGRTIEGVTSGNIYDTSAWPDIDIGSLDDESRKEFLRRKTAILMYLDGASHNLIKEKTGIGLKQAYRLLKERCGVGHEDGRLQGWRGLIKYSRINGYQRKNSVKADSWGYGNSGALGLLLSLEPKLRDDFHKQILKTYPEGILREVKNPRMGIIRWFIDRLKQLGLEARHEWPFNTKKLGYVSITKYVDSVLSANPTKAARIIGGPEGAKKMKSGDGTGRPITDAFKRVEADAHKLDGRFCIMYPNGVGIWEAKIVHRLWVVVIVEIISRVVLGYHLSMRREVNKSDVLSAIKSALTKWKPMKITFSDLAYHDGAGFPSSYDERFVGACWDEFSVDGALANTCKSVETIISDVVGGRILSPTNSFSSRRSLDDRPYIETFFRTLGQRGFQRMSNSTGGRPSDKKGTDPDKVAITSQFQVEYAEELLDVLIANYNCRPHGSVGHRSPLAYLDYVTSREGIELRHADPSYVASILSIRKQVTVRGGYEVGRRPYVNFWGKYSADWLDNRHDLVGKKIWVTNHIPNDARIVQASTEGGFQLGILKAHPPWHQTPHSLSVRQAILSLEYKRCIHLALNTDPILALFDYVESQENKKLPVHPAYLEARRILEQYAEHETSLPLDIGPKTELDGTTKAVPDPMTQPRKRSNNNDIGIGPRPSLPARRKAIQK